MPLKRKNLSKKQRFDIFERDGFICRYCGKSPPDVKLVVDHIFPVSMGGNSETPNLITSCFECNSGKSDRVLSNGLSENNDLRIAQEYMELKSRAEASINALKERKKLEQEICNYYCTVFDTDSIRSSNLSFLLNRVEEFGIQIVFDWINQTYERGVTEYNAIRYMAGIAKRVRLERESDAQ